MVTYQIIDHRGRFAHKLLRANTFDNIQECLGSKQNRMLLRYFSIVFVVIVMGNPIESAI